MPNNSAENEVPPSFPSEHIDIGIHDYYEYVRLLEIPVLILEGTGNISFVNAAFHRIFQYPDDFFSQSIDIRSIISPCVSHGDDLGAAGGICDLFQPGTFIRASVLNSLGAVLPSLVSVTEIPGSTLMAATVYPRFPVPLSPVVPDKKKAVHPACDDASIPFEIFENYPHAVIVLFANVCRYYNIAARKLLGKTAFPKDRLPKVRLVHNNFSELVEPLSSYESLSPPNHEWLRTSFVSAERKLLMWRLCLPRHEMLPVIFWLFSVTSPGRSTQSQNF